MTCAEPRTQAATRPASALEPVLIDLDDITAAHRPRVGAKAYQLARLRQAGFQVPPGVCLPAGTLGPNASLPPGLLEALRIAWKGLGGGPLVVRSSALEEDGADASWAGIFSSCLNVTDEPALVAAIQRCQQSLQAERARAFRRQQRRAKARTPEAAMAILVQRQVAAERAGVLFTRDPCTRDPCTRDPCTRDPCRTHSKGTEGAAVNALLGLGEPLVSGELSGDRFQLDARGRQRHARIDPQPWRLGPGGREPLAAELGCRPALDASQLRQLANLGARLEASLGAPQDVEFAWDREGLWVLQSRPIASQPPPDAEALEGYRRQSLTDLQDRIAELRRRRLLRQPAGVLSNGNIGELLPSPTPLSFALFQHLFTGEGGAIPRGRQALGYRIDARANRHLFTLVAGQPYFHLELDARTYQLRHPEPLADYLARVRVRPALANYPEFGLYCQLLDDDEASRLFGQEEGGLRALDSHRHYQAMHRQARDYWSHYSRRVEPELRRHRLSMTRSAPGTTAQAQLIRIHALIQHLQQVSCYHFVIAARLGFYFAEALRWRLQRWLPREVEGLMGSLLQALPGSLISEQLLDLGDLSEGRLSQADFVARYGHLALNELEISLPRFHEAPEQLDRLQGDGERRATSRRRFRDQLRQRKACERQLRARLAQLACPPEEGRKIFADLRLARRYLPLRETLKYHFAAEYDLLRQALLGFARGTGLAEGDIFYLEPAELSLALSGPARLQSRIQERRRDHELARALAASDPLPPVLFNDRLNEAARLRPATGHSWWQGEGIAPGIRRGRLRRVEEHTDLKALALSLGPEDIIVTRSANLGLAPLLRGVAGLVVEIGGFLAHAACQAREAGIPAMVLPDATRLLQDGGRVRLDGGRGRLELSVNQNRERVGKQPPRA